jgi:hypothetical protein
MTAKRSGVIPVHPFNRCEVQRNGPLNYSLVAYTGKDLINGWYDAPWPLQGFHLTRGGAERAARRVLRRRDYP